MTINEIIKEHEKKSEKAKIKSAEIVTGVIGIMDKHEPKRESKLYHNAILENKDIIQRKFIELMKK